MASQKKHDQWYKKLFSNPVFVQELFTTFVKEDFVKELDFSRLSRVDKTFICDQFKERESDIIYQIQYRRKKAYIYLLVEFQSTVDRFMALRVLSYVTQFYMMLIEGNRPRKLPPVFPLVLYNGDAKWNAPVSMDDLLEKSLPRCYTPQFCYYKVAENEFSKKDLIDIKNAVSALFFVENSTVEEVRRSTSIILDLLRNEGKREIELFINWVAAYLRAEGDNDAVVAIHELEEAESMWANAVKEYGDKVYRQGVEEATVGTVLRAHAAGLTLDQISKVAGIPKSQAKSIISGNDTYVQEKRPRYGSKQKKKRA